MKPLPPSEQELFHAALELPSAQRAAYLAQACAGDVALRARIEALLAVQSSADALFDPASLETHAGGNSPGPSGTGTGGTIKINSPTEKPGDTIGRYKLLQQIGEGGCGVVYMAEQSESVRRRVALKVIKLGMDTKQVVARFEAERQALALMDHPNIAKVLDAGSTSTGRPFFVMELVRGTKVTEFCDQQKLATKERLDLFIQVCSAIQHAHQKGIIHRDIKPSNVLVTLHDGVPVPKVIDFGIAKATTDQQLTDKTLFTAFEQFIGTPAYMSPEQAEMSGLDIDTRSDIYSLGVLLYELLTGKTPFDPQELLRSGVDGIRRTLRDQEPVRPSAKLNTLAELDLTTVANARHSEAPKLLQSISGDLDWVVMKCLEKDRARRYETANGLAADLKRHLSNEPIVARPPSMGYLFQKAIRRNKLAFAAAGAISLALLVGIAASVWQAVRATKAEGLATQRLGESEKARADAEAISKFLTGMFESTRPGEGKGGREVKVAEVLDIAANKLETDLTDQPERRAQLQATLGRTYHTLGLYEVAITLFTKARDWRLAHLGPDHHDTLKAMQELAWSYCRSGRWSTGLPMQEEVLARCRKALGPEHTLTITVMREIAQSYQQAGRADDALKLREEMWSLCRRVLGDEHPYTIAALQGLAASYSGAGRRDEVLKMSEQVLALNRKVLGSEHPETIRAMNSLGAAYIAVGRNDEAVLILEEELALSRKVNGAEHPDTLEAMSCLAGSYWATGRQDKAFKMREVVLSLRRKVSGPEHPKTLGAMTELGALYDTLGRKAEAEALRKEAAAIQAQAPKPPATKEAEAQLNQSTANSKP